MIRTPLLLACAAALSGCATRGTLTFDCSFDGQPYANVAETSPLIRDIGGDIADPSRNGAIFTADTIAASSVAPTDGQPIDLALQSLFAPDNGVALSVSAVRPRNILLLSGGGQWGAYGAGFLQWLDRSNDHPLPRFQIVTGISTGALQALYLGALSNDPVQRKSLLAALAAAYAPANESEIVNRNPMLLAITKGSVAGLAPLRTRVENALCPPGQLVTASPCPLIDALAISHTQSFVGFVDGFSGKFVIASINAIAKRIEDPAGAIGSPDARKARYEKVRACLAGVTIGSAAVPVFYQQVRIKGNIAGLPALANAGAPTVYDGGVRHSVFEADLARRAAVARKQAGLAAMRTLRLAAPPVVPDATLYVLRNGPTTVVENDKVSIKADALTAAKRGYAILVNQSEVGSIASLRLARPAGPIFLTTADGYDKAQVNVDPAPGVSTPGTADGLVRPEAPLTNGCTKTEGPMFIPEFMACLQAFGRAKASRPQPWSQLCALTERAGDPAPPPLCDSIGRQ